MKSSDKFVLGMNCMQKQNEHQLTNWQAVQADMD